MSGWSTSWSYFLRTGSVYHSLLYLYLIVWIAKKIFPVFSLCSSCFENSRCSERMVSNYLCTVFPRLMITPLGENHCSAVLRSLLLNAHWRSNSKPIYIVHINEGSLGSKSLQRCNAILFLWLRQESFPYFYFPQRSLFMINLLGCSRRLLRGS